MRVHELAKELEVTSKDLLAALDAMGFEGRTASSSVPDEAVPRLRASGGKAVPGAKPKAAREEPVAKARARPRAKAQPEPEPKVEPGSSAQDLAEKVGRTPADIVKILLSLGEMVTATQSLSDEAISLVATE